MAKRTFDIELEARSLYQHAKDRGDAAGAASVLRLLRDLKPAPVPTKPRGLGFEVEQMTASEGRELDDLLLSIEQFKARVRARLGVEPAPAPAPPPPPQVEVPEIATPVIATPDPDDVVEEVQTWLEDGTEITEHLSTNQLRARGAKTFDELDKEDAVASQ